MLSNLPNRLGLSLLLLSAGNSSVYSQPLQDVPALSSSGSYSQLGYDQIVAHPPVKQAPIAAVALAQINIAIYKAKRITEQNLCDGQWTPLGDLLHGQGTLKNNPVGYTDFRKTSWHVSILRHPQNLSCGDISRAQFFMEMSRHLPEWIQIRPAGQLAAFQQGKRTLQEHASLAFGGTPAPY